MKVSSILHDETRLRITAVKKRDWWERDPDYDDDAETREGDDIELRARYTMRRYVIDVGVDFLTPHRPRDAKSPAKTAELTRRWLTKTKELGRVVPVHFQEPFRRGYGGYSPEVKDYDLGAKRLFEQLDEVERRTIGRLKIVLTESPRKPNED